MARGPVLLPLAHCLTPLASLSHCPHSLPYSPCPMPSHRGLRDSTTYVGAWGKGSKQHNTGSKGEQDRALGWSKGIGPVQGPWEQDTA